MIKRVCLSKGWAVLQDVHDTGEILEIYKEGWNPQEVGPTLSEWEPIEHLDHLQLLFADTPYFGRELRYFNHAPWWYKKEFTVDPEYEGWYAALCFQAVDYFCSVWLNGVYLGEHEGYFAPFEFDVSEIIKVGAVNTLIVKVSSPWDNEVLPGGEKRRFWAVVRDMVKGTYEHADTFVQRDVNPIGIWGDVDLVFDTGIRMEGTPRIDSRLSSEQTEARIQTEYTLFCRKANADVTIYYQVHENTTGLRVADWTENRHLVKGENRISTQLSITEPRLWTTWDRGEPELYVMSIEIQEGIQEVTRVKQRFGVRSIELYRTKDETTFYLNGKRLFVRGTTYFPDVYISSMYDERYRRDLDRVRALGMNAVRIHVHVEKPEFYDLCDEMGIAVIQDSDLNWVHPTDEDWKDRALAVFRDMIVLLRNHPSIIGWVCFNEPEGGSSGELMTVCPGPQLYAEAKRLDPDRPAIKGSWCSDDLESGDSHNYLGSLNGNETHYLDILNRPEKLNTEFGIDAPAHQRNLRRVPRLYDRLKTIVPNIDDLQSYQYRLLKFYVDRYRLSKYNPCSGYFQFMFIDFCPQSFYGIYDWWGVPKKGVNALEESNQPLAVILDYDTAPRGVWVVNDTLEQYEGCTAELIVTDQQGILVAAERQKLDIGGDSLQKVADLDLVVEDNKVYRIYLALRDSSGRLVAENTYDDPFSHPAHPEGHPHRMNHEIGVRLFHA